MLAMLKSQSLNNSGVKKIESVLDIPKSSFTGIQKAFMLSEQLVFGQYLTMIEPNNPDYTRFYHKCVQAVRELGGMHEVNPGVESSDYRKAITTLRNVTEQNSTSTWVGVGNILNHPTYGSGIRQLPKSFYNPLLFSISGIRFDSQEEGVEDELVDNDVVLLFPTVYRNLNKLCLDYTVEAFPSFSYDTQLPVYDNQQVPILKHLSRLNWNGKSFGNVVNTIAQLKSPHTNTGQPGDVVESVYMGLTNIGAETLGYDDGIITAMQFIGHLTHVYHMPLTDFDRIGSFLASFKHYDADTVKYLIDTNASTAQQKRFNSKMELRFLAPAIEARMSCYVYGREDASSSEEGADENDSGVTDDSTGDAGDVPEDTGGDIDAPSDDGMSMTDDDGDLGDDSSLGDDAADSGELTGEAVKATDTQSSDPTSIVFEIMRVSPSLETIIYRLKTEVLLRELLNNPPADMSAAVLKSLKIWLTEWLFIAAPSVTNKFLTLKLSGVK